MNAYLILTGGVFGLAGIAHLVRLFLEQPDAGPRDPVFIASNLGLFVMGIGIATWAVLLLRRQMRQSL